jgi:DNA-binding transcriptional ArsR family regulator
VTDSTTTIVEQRLAYLRRVAIVFAAEIRIKIVSELYQREMSAKQFFEEFGGGSITRVDRHFKRLAEHGWLRYVRSEGPDSQRRGSEEHFFRAPELAILDNESWALLPYSVRVATSWRTFKTLGERVRDAAVAGTLDARGDGNLSCHTMDLDEQGWTAIIRAVDAYFESIFEEQADARLRMSHSGERPLVATIALTAFESPPPLDSAGLIERTTPLLVPAPSEPPMPFYRRLSKVMGDNLSLMILNEANNRRVSAPILTTHTGADYQWVRRRVKGLEEFGWLLQVGEEKRLNASELFYRATAPAFFDNESWAAIPAPAVPTLSWNIFKLLARLVKDAIIEGTFESRLDNHLSWSVLRLDERGWENIARALDLLLAFVLGEQERAELRLAASGARPIRTTVGLGAFESPTSAVREP